MKGVVAYRTTEHKSFKFSLCFSLSVTPELLSLSPLQFVIHLFCPNALEFINFSGRGRGCQRVWGALLTAADSSGDVLHKNVACNVRRRLSNN